MRKLIIPISLVILLLGGCAGYSEVPRDTGSSAALPSALPGAPTSTRETGDEPPSITVMAGDISIGWQVGKNEWNGSIYDRMDNFHRIMSQTSFDDLPYVGNGETITIQFAGDVPESYTLTEYILRDTGDMKYNIPGMECVISFDSDGFGAFFVEPNFATGLSSNSEDYLPGNTIKGYRLVCRWGRNVCEYGFIIRSDAFVSMSFEPLPFMTILSTSPSGLTFTITNPTENEYIYGESYSLLVFSANRWDSVEPITESWGFNSIGYTLEPNATSDEAEINWQWLFGDLPPGDYMLQKSIIYLRSPGDFDEFFMEQQFSIP